MRPDLEPRATSALAACALLGSLAWGCSGASQEAPREETETARAPSHALAEPGAHHRHLEPLLGSWHTQRTFWPTRDSDPVVSGGTSTYSFILDGHYLQEEVRGSAMDVPFEGLAIQGYDNFRKEHLGFWIDSLSTSVVFYATGTCEDDGATVVLRGRFDNPSTGQKDLAVRTVRRIESPDLHVLEMYAEGSDGREFKTLEVLYTRLEPAREGGE